MAKFKVVMVKHGYGSAKTEARIVTAAGGEFIDADPLPEEDGLRLCEEADAILVRWLRVTPALIQRFRRCKIIVRYGVGTDNVDVNAATQANIIVGHVPDYCFDDVSSHAIGLWLACVRAVAATHQKIVSGTWDVNPRETMFRTAGKTMGIVGLGNIGQATARKLAGWRMRLLATDPFIEPERASALGVQLVDLDTLCRESDYISLHVPLLPETKHLINQRTLSLMKHGAILVNTARGPIVETEALAAALNEGRLASAGLDVFEEEPLPKNSPLRKHPRVTLSDHVAWYSEESLAELRATATEEAVRVCTGGLPRSLANPEVLHRLGRWQEWTPNATVRWQMKRLAKLGKSFC